MERHAEEYEQRIKEQNIDRNDQEEAEKGKKVKKKQDSDVNQNINVCDTASLDSEPPPQLTNNTLKIIEVNEFSDHSDSEYGFGPLPASVFQAIEDSQGSEQTEEMNQTPPVEYHSEESNKSELPMKESSKNPSKKVRTRVCPICTKVYTASSSYFYHVKHTHKRIKEHECSVCGKKFATRPALKIHTATHTGESKFQCNLCKKCFRSKASLYIHEQTHSGVKSLSCTQCHRSFRWKTHLMRHMQRHSAEKGHVCATCGRGFSIRCDLLRHARTHTAGNFSCDKCDVKFAQMRYLKVHMEKKHSTKIVKP